MRYLSLIWPSLWYRPGRTALTLLSMTAAFLLLGIAQTVSYALSHPAPAFRSDLIVVFNRSSYGLPLPFAYRDVLAQMPGVELVSPSALMDGYYLEPSNTITADAVDPRPFFAMLGDQIGISAGQLQALETTRSGAIVGPRIAAKYGWKAGDIINMHSASRYVREDGSVDWTFTIVGILNVKDPGVMDQFGNRIIIQYAYYDAASLQNRGKVDLFMVRPDTSADAGKIGAAIDARFGNSPYETRSTPLRALFLIVLKQLGDIGAVLTLIISVVLGTLAFMIGNAMMHTFHERIPEYAVLKTIGYTDAHVALLLVAESLLTCALGAAAGLGLASVLLPLLNRRLHVVNLSSYGLLPVIGMATALALAVALAPAWRAHRLQIADALAART